MAQRSKWSASLASIASAATAIACPLCIPAVGAFLTSLGLGFALRVEVLHSLLIALLVLCLGSLAWSARRHHRWWILTVGAAGAVIVYVGRYVWFSLWLMGLGALLLIGSSGINLRMKSHCHSCAVEPPS